MRELILSSADSGMFFSAQAAGNPASASLAKSRRERSDMRGTIQYDLRVRSIAAALPLILAACGGSAAVPKPAPPMRPAAVLIITIDTLRADRVGIYGGTVETPSIDRLAR